ncbi:hypothetical protein D3C84_1197420 [compost metagenome]
MPRERWPADREGLSAVLKHWIAGVGDCRQELVFIGQGIDFDRLRAELDACLLDDVEMAEGPQAWALLPDPFGPWHDEEAA